MDGTSIFFAVLALVCAASFIFCSVQIAKCIIRRFRLKTGTLLIHTLLARAFFTHCWEASPEDLSSKILLVLSTGLTSKQILAILVSEPGIYSSTSRNGDSGIFTKFYLNKRFRPPVSLHYFQSDLKLQEHITSEILAAELERS